MIKTGRPWNDEHVDVSMYYLRKKAKYTSVKPITYTTTDVFFMKWVLLSEKQWKKSNKNMSSISPDHSVGQYIRGYKIPANIPWDIVDNVMIPVNLSESFHWILVVFCIRRRCLYVYNSLVGGAVNTKNMIDHVQSLATMIPLFFSATCYYGKRSDIDWQREPAYIDKADTDPLNYEIVWNAPQQHGESNDCGVYACAFAEYISHGIFDISSVNFHATNHRQRYGTLLWDYARRKQNDGAISKSEVTGHVTSKFGGPKISRESVLDIQKLQGDKSKYKKR